MNKIQEIIKKYTIGDGLNVVVDHQNSKGSWLVDLDGKRYLDCFSSFASQPLGWNHPSLVEGMNKVPSSLFLHKIANSDLYCKEYASFIEEFASILPDFSHFFFIDGGTLAVENAIKAAFDYKMKKMGWKEDYLANNLDIIHLEKAFHGRSGYCLSLTNTKKDKIWGFPKFNWTRLKNPSINENISLIQAEESLKKGNVAAILLELINCEGGDIHLSESYLHNLRSLAYKYDTLFIVDEIQTGVAATGKMWCYEHFGLKPDIICFGKKTQVCGIAATTKIDEIGNNVFRESSRINSTWGSNLIDQVRFTIISQIIKEEKLVDNAREVGEYFLTELKSLGLENARGRGLILAFDLENSEKRDNFHQKISDKMLVLKCGDKSIRLRPHLTFSKEDVDFAIKFIKEIL